MPVPFDSSRRVTLAALAGAAIHGSSALKAAPATAQILVCIRLSDPTDAVLLAGGADVTPFALSSTVTRAQVQLHPALASIAPLFSSQAAAVVREPGGEQSWDYIPGGFTAPTWMSSAAGASILNSSGRAFTFKTGLLMLTPGGMGTSGPQFENPALLSQARSGNATLPNTAIGQQLRQIVGLAANGNGGRRMFVASLGGALVAGSPAEQRAARFRGLGEALVAFQNALDAAGLGGSVVVFTEAGSGNASMGDRTRLVIGRTVLGGKMYKIAGATGATATLANWAGYRPDSLGLTASGERFVY